MAGAGDGLVWTFLLLSAGAAVLRAAFLWVPPAKHPFDLRRISRILVFATLANALVLAGVWEFLFLTSDVSYFYVWDHSAAEHALLWKIEGLWAGQEGSIFLWAASMTTALALNEVLHIRRERRAPSEPSKGGSRARPSAADSRLGDWTAFFVSMVIASFGIVLVASDWFRLTASEVHPFLLQQYPTGFGLSPSLRTELNVIHPPIELTGYALTVMPMAAAFAYLATGERLWIRYCAFWTRIAWVFLTTGLALGGLWAYITLGWGGYWAWDPVEVASLMPWLATTALLHAQIMHRRHEMYPLAAPLLAAIAFSLTEFGTFVTRSGVWQSVHSFIQSPNVSIGDAIANALSSDVRLAVFFAMIFVPLGTLVVLLSHFLRHYYKEVSFLPPRGVDEDLVDYLARDKFTVFAGIFALCVVLLMTFIILVKNAGLPPQPAEFETKLAIPLFVILFFIVVNYLRRPLGNENALLVAVVASFAGAMGYILFPAPPSATYWKLAGAAIPLVVANFLMGALRVRGALRRSVPSSLKARARTVAVIAIHVAVAAVVLGYVTSNVFVKEDDVILQEAGPSSPAVTDAAFGYVFELTNISKDPNAGSSAREHWDKFDARYNMYDGGGRLVRSGEAFIIYKRPGPEPSPDNFAFTNYEGAPVLHTDVYTTPTFDLYIQINNLLPGRTNGSVAVELSVKQIPGTWAIWGGVVMMVGGMVTLMAVEYTGAAGAGRERFVPADDPRREQPSGRRSVPSRESPPAEVVQAPR
jgi:cytochrome c-type biogenesis protein CcmF